MSGVSIGLRSLAKSLAGHEVLRGPSLEVAAGEWLALLGPSGAGKTTLLRLIAGLERPDSGQILFDGRDVAGVAPRDRRIGLVFQDLALWPYLSVEEHLREVAPQTVETMIERFGLSGMERRRPHELSGGEKQRLALARAVAGDPRILLLDEPLSSLDPLLRRKLASTLAELHRERGMTTINVTQHLEAGLLGSCRIALLTQGRIEQVGTLSELRANPRTEWVGAFVAEEAEIET